MTATNESIVKSDRRGRLRYAPEQKAALVEAYQSSGLSGPRFAAMHGVNYQTLATWLLKSKRALPSAAAGSKHPAFLSLVPAEMDAPGLSGAIQPMEVTLPGGTKLAIAVPGHIQLAAALIRELAISRPC